MNIVFAYVHKMCSLVSWKCGERESPIWGPNLEGTPARTWGQKCNPLYLWAGDIFLDDEGIVIFGWLIVYHFMHSIISALELYIF